MELILDKGDIVKIEERVNVIVNSTSSDLVLSYGEVSEAILTAGGATIQQECKDNYKNGIKFGEIAVTSGGNLNCDKIYHTSLPAWSDNGSKVLEDVIMACLDKASGEGFEYMAFPALGTGILKYPVGEVTKIFFNTIIKFVRKGPSSVRKVILIALDSNNSVITAFHNERLEQIYETNIEIISRLDTTISIAFNTTMAIPEVAEALERNASPQP